YKPVESGCLPAGDSLMAADAQTLWEAAGGPGELADVCPQRFDAPLAPPQAAAREGKSVDAELLRRGMEYWNDRADFVLVEGAGGLMSPLSAKDYNADLADDLGLPLVIVATNELGVINATLQTIITARAVAPTLPIAGVVLNQTVLRTEDQSVVDNAAQLLEHSNVPLLATVDFQQQDFQAPVDWFELGQ
ncbi:MAG: dethiobiotin synthase, partial [Bythopirellula sp.]